MTGRLRAACVPRRDDSLETADAMLKYAFKEWADICRALALGRQAIILRKGGIAERGGSFQAEHTRFWLYPTYVHQQRSGIRPEASARAANCSTIALSCAPVIAKMSKSVSTCVPLIDTSKIR